MKTVYLVFFVAGFHFDNSLIFSVRILSEKIIRVCLKQHILVEKFAFVRIVFLSFEIEIRVRWKSLYCRTH